MYRPIEIWRLSVTGELQRCVAVVFSQCRGDGLARNN